MGLYAIDAVSFGASAICLLQIVPSLTRGNPASSDRSGLASIGGGLRYVAGRQELIGSYVVDPLNRRWD